MNINPTVAALNGGEDYELLFTIKQSDFDRIKILKGISVIGHITDESAGLALVDKANTEIALTAQGWDAMRN